MGDESAPVYTGGCLCGAIRYSFQGEPALTAICHCSHCQKQSGAAYSIVAVVPNQAYAQMGETSIFEDRGDSGKPLFRHFCGACGSPIMSIAESIEGVTIVKMGTLDKGQGADFVPTLEVHCASALAWVPPLPGAQRFDGSN